MYPVVGESILSASVAVGPGKIVARLAALRMSMLRLKAATPKTVGRAAWGVGAIAWAVPLIWRAFWPTPLATIDAPLTGATVAGCYVTKGRLVPRTIRRPLWLIGAESGHSWRPLERIDSSRATWQEKACIEGFTGTLNGLALVVVDEALDAAFALRQREGDDDLPEWMTPNHGSLQQAGRGRQHRLSGFSPLPEKARLLAVVEIVAAGNPEPLYPMTRSAYDFRGAPLTTADLPSP